MSSNFTNHFSADDAALLLIDFQPQTRIGKISDGVPVRQCLCRLEKRTQKYLAD